jgi:hypothetical protein
MYNFLAHVQGWQITLVMFLEEIVLPLQNLECFDSYKTAVECLKELGKRVYSNEEYSEFVELMSS